jgi:L-iditol 2-dehydrogenase
MRSARIVAPGKIEVVDEPIPSFGEGQVLIRLLRVALCGSDLPYFSNTFKESSYPMPGGYPGHECLGIVVESKAPEYRKDDLVMFYPRSSMATRNTMRLPLALQKLPKEGDLNILLMTQLLGCVSHAGLQDRQTVQKNGGRYGAGTGGAPVYRADEPFRRETGDRCRSPPVAL